MANPTKEQLAAEAEAAAQARIDAAEASAVAAEAKAADAVALSQSAEALAVAAEEKANERLSAAITAEAEAHARYEAAEENDGSRPVRPAVVRAEADTFDYAGNPDGAQYALVPNAMISGRLDHPFKNYVFEEGKPQRGDPSTDSWLRMQIEKKYIALWD